MAPATAPATASAPATTSAPATVSAPATISAPATTSAPAADPFEQAFADLQKWVDTTTGDYLKLHIQRDRRQGRLGEALRLLNKQIDDAPTKKELYEQRLELLDALGWPHWKQYEQHWLLIRFPDKYPPF
jgi:hypothetical protein